jgi:diguanylate cyclase (GGDEF)-like protein
MVIPAVTELVKLVLPKSKKCLDACLVHIYPSGAAMGTRHLLDKADLVLGRDEGCDIVVQDQSVSRRHTRFELGDDGFYAMDLGSTNGTFVNDKPAEGTLLSDGDYVRTANCLFRFLAGGNVEADYHDELYRLAIIDALTGLYNKRYLLDYLDRELARSRRHGRPLALIMFDIDHFKHINDRYGHLAGDLTLRDLANCLKQEIRRDELLARYGGEEFAAVLTETSLEQAAEFAERLRQVVAESAFIHDGHRVPVTVSLGVVSDQGSEAITPKELIRIADERLYCAKREGRNRSVACG